METFPRARVVELLGVSPARLRYWARLGLAAADDGEYSLQDLIALRAVLRLVDQGVPAVRVRAALRAIAGDPLALKKPLLELRLRGSSGQVVGLVDGLLMEPATGQRVLDLDGEAGPAVRELMSVNDMLSWAMRHDLDPAHWDRAANAYARVLEQQPDRVEALINLGTLEFKRQRLEPAEAAYRRALAVLPEDPVILFNLANVLDERGRPAEALPYLLAAFEQDPRNGDVVFNLALLLEKLGRPTDAARHWRAYLDIDGTTEWASLAREHLSASRTEAPWADVIPLRRRPR